MISLSEIKGAELEINEEQEIQDKNKISSELLTAFLHWLRPYTRGLEMLLSDDNLMRLLYNLYIKGEVKFTIILPDGPGYTFEIKANDEFMQMYEFFTFMKDMRDVFDEMIYEAKSLQKGFEELENMALQLKREWEETIQELENLQEEIDKVEELLSPLEEVFGTPPEEKTETVDKEIEAQEPLEGKEPEETAHEPRVSSEEKDEIDRKIEKLEEERGFFNRMVDRAMGFLGKVWNNIKNFFKGGPEP